MMRFNSALLLISSIMFSGQPIYGQQISKKQPIVKYITKDAVYVNAGKSEGLLVGDTLKVIHDGQIGAFVVITHLSSKSTAARVIRSMFKIEIGDKVVLPHINFSAEMHSREGQPVRKSRQKVRRGVSRKTKKKAANHLQGYYSIQSYLQDANGGMRLSSFQPSMSGRLKIKNLLGTGMEFRLRQRSRFYNRSYSSGYSLRGDEWVHRVSEICLSYAPKNSAVRFGIGRVYSRHIRGIGLIDGVYISTGLGAHFRVGVAAGMEPNFQTSAFNSKRNKYGAFLALETGSYARQRFATTVAFSASSENGTVNREFVYLQNNYTLANRISLYQSVEIDLNRRWRRAAAGKSLTFSNIYLTANLHLSDAISLNFSYDARKNVRTLNTINTPDSLFDDVVRKGLSTGLSLNLPANIRLGANLFVRFQEGHTPNTVSSSYFLGIRRFPFQGHSVSARLAHVSTEFTTAYRPTFTYRLPLGRKLLVTLGSGGYIYQTAGQTKKSYYVEMQGHYSFMKRFFLSANYRQYLDKFTKSKQLSMEIGVSF